MSLSHELKFSHPYILATRWCKPLIFQTLYLRSTVLGCKDIGIGKSEFAAKTPLTVKS